MDIYAYHLEHPKKSQWQVSLAFRVSKGTVCSPRVPIWTQSLTSLWSLPFSFFLSFNGYYFVLFPAVFRGFLSSFPRHRMPVFFPLYGEVRSSLLRFNPATISRPLRTSTSRPFRISIPRHSMPAFILSIVPDAIRLFRRTGRPADTLVYKSHTRVGVYI